MKTTMIRKGIALAIVAVCGSTAMAQIDDIDTEKAAIRQVIEASIGWAMNKDFDLLFNSVAQDSNFFIFHPDNASTIVGFSYSSPIGLLVLAIKTRKLFVDKFDHACPGGAGILIRWDYLFAECL